MISEYIDNFTNYLKIVRGFSEHTIRNYSIDLVSFLNFLNERKICDLKKIDRIEIRAYLASLHKGHIISTVLRKLSTIRSFFRYLRREGIVTANPAKLIEMPKKNNYLPTVLSKDEIFNLIEKLDENN